jgi:type II secretory ATPase GspE/PulE/Tfp pilus assembly ATPase PilB-like protein
MLHTLAQTLEAQPVWLMSLFKPLLMLIVLGGWAWVISFYDKDLAYYFLPRQMWNGIQMGLGVAAFGLWLTIPLFWLGFVLALVLLGGGVLGYALFRNSKVQPSQRWDFSLASFKKKVEEAQQAQAQKRAMLVMMTKDEGELEVPVGDDPRAMAHQTLEKVLDFALTRGADRFDMAVDSSKAVIVARIDGVKYPQPAVEPKIAVALIDYLKANAGLDLQDRRRRQNGVAHVRWGEDSRHALEINTHGSVQSMTASVLIDPTTLGNISYDKLGLLEPQRQAMQPILGHKGGVVIVSSPSGHGQTTTLYSLVQTHDPYTQGVVAYEIEKAYDIEGVNHLQRPGDDPQANIDQLAGILRRDPDVVMLDKLTDTKMAQMVAKSSEDIRFYFGLPQTDVFSTLKTWIKATGEAPLAAEHLAAVLSQRLIRKLCPTCRIGYTPDVDALRKLNLPADKVQQLFKAGGKIKVGKEKEKTCPTCYGIGYRGRFAVYEVMVLDDEARKLVASGQLDALRAHVRKQKMLYLQEAALARVVEGTTDIKEITRALSSEK